MEKPKKDWNFIIIYILIILVLLSVIITGYLVFDNMSCRDANEYLKKENYELKAENKKLKDKAIEARSDADKWFSNYIDLGIQCGANE